MFYVGQSCSFVRLVLPLLGLTNNFFIALAALETNETRGEQRFFLQLVME